MDTVVKEDVPAPTTPAAGKDQHNGERPDVKHEKKHVPAQAKPKEEQQAKAKPQAPEEKPSDDDPTPGLKVLGKIDLSQFEPKKGGKKRERIAKGSQKVDVAKEGKQADNSSKKDKDKNKNAKQGQEQGKGNKKRNRGADRFKPAMTEEEQEAMQKEIQKQVKETYARMNDNKKNNFGAKYRKEKREQAAAKTQEEMAHEMAEKKVLKVTEFVTVNDLATLMNNTPVNEVIKACMELGLMVSINQRLDAEALVLVAEQFGYKVEFVTADLTEEIEGSSEQVDREEDLVPRPPIITVMGHVDHGKTSLLDYIRKSNVIAGEAGGITQHIGAYNVKLPDGRRITFLDTPGHEAFTAMRARGAQLTDLAIIIIAADDAVMPQTVEAINHAQAAHVPIVVAVNKIDKPGANPDKVRGQLTEYGLVPEEYGGNTMFVDISAKQGTNVDKLLEAVLLTADAELDLRANPDMDARGATVEARLDKGRGAVATVLVQSGTLHIGDAIVAGTSYGRVRAMLDENGNHMQEAGPSTPVQVLGLTSVPTAGDLFLVASDDRTARQIAEKRQATERAAQLAKRRKVVSLESLKEQFAKSEVDMLNIVIKGDSSGSVEALEDSLMKIEVSDEVGIQVIHRGVGAITQNDVNLATVDKAVIIGFNVRPNRQVADLAEREGVEIKYYSIIYKAIEDIEASLKGMLKPEYEEVVTSHSEIREIFRSSKFGNIAGVMVQDGEVKRGTKCRILRNGIATVNDLEISSLRRFKDDVQSVKEGYEAGINLGTFNDIEIGDIIETFEMQEIERK